MPEHVNDGLLYFNGINGETGDYDLPPMTGDELSQFIKGEAKPENLSELRHRQESKDSDESRILTWSGDGARVWDSRSGAVLTPPLQHKGGVAGAQFSADGSRVLTWSGDGSARVWDSTSGAALAPPFEHDKAVNGALFSADGGRILTWSDDSSARVWDSMSGAALTPPLEHKDSVRGAQFSADGSRILTWSWDGSARLWCSGGSGAPLTPGLPHDPVAGEPRIDRWETKLRTWTEAGGLRTWDLTIDTQWPIGKRVLRVEVETGTILTLTGEVKALSTAEWNRKRYCEYDAIRHDLKRLSDAEWAESQRLCRTAQAETDSPP